MSQRLIVPAAGAGERLGADCPKALIDLAGEPLLVHTLRRFEASDLLEGAIILHAEGQGEAFAYALRNAFVSYTFKLAVGGATRQESVAIGLALAEGSEIVAIHDAARPFVARHSIDASTMAAREVGAATVAIPSADTILEADDDDFLEATPDRSKLWCCQTPQTFRREVILAAHRAAADAGYTGTDDASLVRRNGGRVKLIPGTSLNLKITTPADRTLAETILKEQLA